MGEHSNKLNPKKIQIRFKPNIGENRLIFLEKYKMSNNRVKILIYARDFLEQKAMLKKMINMK